MTELIDPNPFRVRCGGRMGRRFRAAAVKEEVGDWSREHLERVDPQFGAQEKEAAHGRRLALEPLDRPAGRSP